MRTWLWGCILCGTVAACTTTRDDSRRTLDWLDGNLAPASHTARMVLLPVAIPVGACGVLADTLLVNPACAVDDAWGDTVEVLWTSREESALRKALFTPLAALATPVVFAGDWLWRCVIPTPPRSDDVRAPASAPKPEAKS